MAAGLRYARPHRRGPKQPRGRGESGFAVGCSTCGCTRTTERAVRAAWPSAASVFAELGHHAVRRHFAISVARRWRWPSLARTTSGWLKLAQGYACHARRAGSSWLRTGNGTAVRRHEVHQAETDRLDPGCDAMGSTCSTARSAR
jgi:hypothetical protein